MADFVDPFAGSYAVETLTTEIERRAGEYLARIDEMGGMVAAIAANVSWLMAGPARRTSTAAKGREGRR